MAVTAKIMTWAKTVRLAIMINLGSSRENPCSPQQICENPPFSNGTESKRYPYYTNSPAHNLKNQVKMLHSIGDDVLELLT